MNVLSCVVSVHGSLAQQLTDQKMYPRIPCRPSVHGIIRIEIDGYPSVWRNVWLAHSSSLGLIAPWTASRSTCGAVRFAVQTSALLRSIGDGCSAISRRI